MTWITAFKVAIPVWIVIASTVGAIMYHNDFAAEIGSSQSLARFILVVSGILPLTVFLIKTTGDDLVRYRKVFFKNKAEEDDR